jgi:hypothetical protein
MSCALGLSGKKPSRLLSAATGSWGRDLAQIYYPNFDYER